LNFLNPNLENKMREQDQIIIQAIQAEIDKLDEGQQEDCYKCYHDMDVMLSKYGLPAQLALALLGARIAAEE
jgi:hypothetical protein